MTGHPAWCYACRQVTSGDCGQHTVTVPPQPYRCPVCEGKGCVPSGFYGAVGTHEWTVSDLTPEQCRSCGGIGVIWR